MFRNRTNSQKPHDELLSSFKASFPHLSHQGRSATTPSASGHTLTDALDVAHHSRPPGEGEDLKDADPTPRGSNEPWRFTPSLMDPNSFAFHSFANQPPGYYTPTPGGTTLYHNQAGDLHTPGFTMGLGTPLSLPTSEASMHIGQVSHAGMSSFHHHAMAPHHFQNPNPFAAMHQQQSFAPHQFQHQSPAFDSMGHSHDGSPMNPLPMEVDSHEQSPLMTFNTQPLDPSQMAPLPQQSLENFRYHVTLNAPTAMIKHAEEIPVTYLNKGQAYSVSIVDTNPAPIGPMGGKYRTFIRISFEDETQRAKPSACWQLWKEGRGTNEAHQRGGKLQAVEFVDPSQIGGGDLSNRPKIELESASFDGFCVTWSPPPNSSPECSISVRFNFLSTDFSHSKGVKGIPVRLTAKTELLDNQSGSPPEAISSELCYCKVKLFRDHGAERKLSNDVAHVKKTIDKLKQQIAQSESGMKDFGKRKRSGSISKASASNRPGKVPKHKRTWSMISDSDTGTRPPAEEDLHLKLATLQDMFTSTRPVSVLYLRGEDLDDPDVHPVQLVGEPADLTKLDTNPDSIPMWDRQSSHTGAPSTIVSPTPSSQSIHSSGRKGSVFQQPTPFAPPSRVNSNEWRCMQQTATGDLQPVQSQTLAGISDVPVKIQKPQAADGTLAGWIEALGVDYSYQPPPERLVKPVACIYIQPRISGQPAEDPYYRAVYLMQRTLRDLVQGIAMKSNIEPTQVIRTLRVTRKGLTVLMDDEGVQDLPEGQDLTAEFHSVKPSSPQKREWDSGPTDIQVDGDVSAIENVNSAGYELRLLF